MTANLWSKNCIRRNKRGAYVLEATLLLPLIVLCILSLGYVTKVEGIWENSIHCAIDESGKVQAMSCDGVSPLTAKARIDERLRHEKIDHTTYGIRGFLPDYSDGEKDHITSYTLSVSVHMDLPAGFSRDFDYSAPIVYRGFTGKEMSGYPLGTSGLENGQPGDPAYIFPAFGKKYHNAECSYVKATVHSERLNSSIRNRYDPCSICHSSDLSNGSIVFCFESEGTAYHRASCRTINRHVILIDRSEAEDKGYTPCSKCGI